MNGAFSAETSFHIEPFHIEPMTNDASETENRRDVALKLSGRAKLFVVLGSVVFGLLVCEVALRVAGYTYPIFYTPDAARGYALRPGAEGWYRKEGRSYVRINSDGLRDREHALEKPAATLRIAVVGDSYAEALQVAQEKAFPTILESKLQNCAAFGGKKIEVINFGVSGYGTTQELITLRERVRAYAPDIVLLAFTTNNDVTDNSRSLKRTDEIPYFVPSGDGELVLDNSFRDTRAFRLRDSTPYRAGMWIRNHLRVIQAIHEGQGAIRNAIKSWRSRGASDAPDNRKESPAPAQKQAAAALADELGIDNLIYREPDDSTWTDAWKVTEKLLVLMRDEVRSHGAKFLVVTLSNGVQVQPDASAREEFLRRVGATDIFYPDRRIKALGERENFTVLNLAPALQRYAEEHRVFLHGFDKEIGNGHWNELGHAVAGDIIAQSLCEGSAR
ncbi:MAG: SGNH/GDSL hydrolase family protein [Pyrinomonadaceae bacterium]